MKRLIKTALLCGVLGLATNGVEASTPAIVLKTYFVLNGLRQTDSGAVNVRITNKDVLAALNATGNFNFGSGAQIIVRSIDDQLPAILVRFSNGGTVDVGSYLSLTDSGNEIHTRNNLTSWSIWNYVLGTGTSLDFHLSGMVTLQRGPIRSSSGTLTRVYKFSSPVYGPGDVGGSPTVFYGSVYGGSATAEAQ